MAVIDVEEIYTILKGITMIQKHVHSGKYIESEGADFSLTLNWFKNCGIIDSKVLTEGMFVEAYERLAPNREDLTLTQMITLFSILSRETRLDVDAIAVKFEQVKDDVIGEIREYWREVEKLHKTRVEDSDALESDGSDEVVGKYVTF